ncbi:hypothetical protein Acor_08390 [Acrocarpospora corrugata]|uniref:Uncharacterized protein n=1 Tax=Acrocarpospora corrugata TaxID=35763 RepID=A0A5M3VQ70_9ACTN|nr:hypothetical protein [Acrocarpospora corrugata]GER98775.1 hypothetical protein Acor_08390 [Acrocarpospora corrugata]
MPELDQDLTSTETEIDPELLTDRLAALYTLVMTDDSLDDPDLDPADWDGGPG